MLYMLLWATGVRIVIFNSSNKRIFSVNLSRKIVVHNLEDDILNVVSKL